MLFAPVLGKRFFELETRRDLFLKESAGSFRSQREEFFIKRDTNTLLASPHAELPGEFDLIFSVIFCDQALEFFNNFSRAFQMTARPNADDDFHRDSPPSNHACGNTKLRLRLSARRGAKGIRRRECCLQDRAGRRIQR